MFTKTAKHQQIMNLICNIDVACDNRVDGLLEVDVLVVVVVVVAVDPVVDVCHSVKDGEGHSGKHQGHQMHQLSTRYK